jgi:hypothetical protein
MSEKAALRRNAFLFSSAVTYGYSPYSRKLGHWYSRTNITHAFGFSFQSSGKSSRLGEHGRDAGLAEQPHGHAGVLGFTGPLRPRSISK